MSFYEMLDRFEKNDLWDRVYQYVNQESEFSYRDLTYNDSLQYENSPYNRYRNILPYDSSRVRLNGPNRENTDYINASLINVPINNLYIACQHPLENTCHHFWQMVYERDVQIIVMLNRYNERHDAVQYWPQSVGASVNYDQFCVTLVSIAQCQSYIIREIDLSYKNESIELPRKVYHYAYLNWPDFGVPRSIPDFLTLINDVNEKRALLNQYQNPIIVHCSAGIGRTGTYIIIDISLNQMIQDNGIDKINPMYILTDIRKFRRGLVQTKEQLRFAYFAIAELIQTYHPELVNSSIPINNAKRIRLFNSEEEYMQKNTNTSFLPSFLSSMDSQDFSENSDGSQRTTTRNLSTPEYLLNSLKSSTFANLLAKYNQNGTTDGIFDPFHEHNDYPKDDVGVENNCTNSIETKYPNSNILQSINDNQQNHNNFESTENSSEESDF